MDDDEPTPEELREAAALAEALEGRPADSAKPEALAAAGLLRYARSEGQLDPLKAGAMSAALRSEWAGRKQKRRFGLWLWVCAPLAGAAVMVMVLALREDRAPRSISAPSSLTSPLAAPLPAPSA